MQMLYVTVKMLGYLVCESVTKYLNSYLKQLQGTTWNEKF